MTEWGKDKKGSLRTKRDGKGMTKDGKWSKRMKKDRKIEKSKKGIRMKEWKRMAKGWEHFTLE